SGAFVAFLFGASAGLADFVLVALLALTIFGTALSRGHVTRILGSRPLVWLGEISYSVYMVHFPVLIVIPRLWGRLGVWPVGPGGACVGVHGAGRSDRRARRIVILCGGAPGAPPPARSDG